MPDVDHAVPDEGGKLDWSSDIFFSKQDSQFYVIKTFNCYHLLFVLMLPEEVRVDARSLLIKLSLLLILKAGAHILHNSPIIIGEKFPYF